MMKYVKLESLLKRFVAEKKISRTEAEELGQELEQILDEAIQKNESDRYKENS